MNRAAPTDLLRAYRSYSSSEADRMSDAAADVLGLFKRAAPFEHVEMAVLEFLRNLEEGIAYFHGGSWIEWALSRKLIWTAPQVQTMIVAEFAEPRARYDPWRIATSYSAVWIRSETDLSLRLRSQFPFGLPLAPPCNRFIQLRTNSRFYRTLESYCAFDALLGGLKVDLSRGDWYKFVRLVSTAESRQSHKQLSLVGIEFPSVVDTPSEYFLTRLLAEKSWREMLHAVSRLRILSTSGPPAD